MASNVGSQFERTLGPFVGVYDSADPGLSNPRKLFDGINVIIPDLADGAPALARHGFLGHHEQLGDALNRTGQAIFEHRRTDGTVDRFVFAGGRMYRWDGSDSATAFVECTPAGISIDKTAPIFCATLNSELLVADGVYRPWIFTPGPDTAVTIKIDTADTDWSTQDGPKIFGDAPFFVLKQKAGSDIDDESDGHITDESNAPITTELLSGFRNTVIWGQPSDARTGYQQDGFENTITLVQTSSEVLGAISAEEGAVIYWRHKGIGSLVGTVNEDFRAAATKDTISSTSGSDSPAAVCVVNRRHYYVDMDGRVLRALVGGGEPQQLWYPVRRELEDHIGSEANRAIVTQCARAAYHEDYGLVLFTIWDRQTLYAFDAESGTFVGTFVIGGPPGASIHIDAMGSMTDADNRACFMIIGTRTNVYGTATQGVVWRQKFSSDTNQWLDQADVSDPTCIGLTRAIESHWISKNSAAEFRVNEVSASLVGDTARHAVGLEYVTPSAGKSTRIVAQSTATVGEKSASDSISRAAWSPGRNAQGSGVRLRLSATHSDNVRWGVHTVTFLATVTKARQNQK